MHVIRDHLLLCSPSGRKGLELELEGMASEYWVPLVKVTLSSPNHGLDAKGLEGCCDGEMRGYRSGSHVGVNETTWECDIVPECERQKEACNSMQDGMKVCSHNN